MYYVWMKYQLQGSFILVLVLLCFCDWNFNDFFTFYVILDWIGLCYTVVLGHFHALRRIN